MSDHSICPTCYKTPSQWGEKYLHLFKCTKCGHLGCCHQHILSAIGCWDGQNCPSCNEYKSYQNVGYIE